MLPGLESFVSSTRSLGSVTFLPRSRAEHGSARRTVRQRAMRYLLLTALLVALAAPGVASAWVTSIGGVPDPDKNANRAQHVTVDPFGHVVAAGGLRNAGASGSSDFDFAVAKFDGVSGAEIWRRSLTGTSTLQKYDEAFQVATDPSGDVIAVGVIENAGTANDFAVVKLSGVTGAELWRTYVEGTNGGFVSGEGRAVVVDAAGNAYVAGQWTNATTSTDLAVAKLSGATGQVLWQYSRSGTSGSAAEYARSIRLTSDGAVVAGGLLTRPGTGDDIAVVKLNATTGSEIWVREIDRQGRQDFLLDLATSPGGDVAVSGYAEALVGSTIVLSMYAARIDGSSGAVEWQYYGDGNHAPPGCASLSDCRAMGWSVTFDGADDVFVAGFLSNVGTRADFAVVKLQGGSGTELWRNTFDGGANQSAEGAKGVRVNAAGDAIVGGTILPNNGPTGEFWTFAVGRFRGTDGQRLWLTQINGSRFEIEEVKALALDGVGNPVAAGSTSVASQNERFTVAKLFGVDGSLIVPGCGNGIVDGGEQCDDGNQAAGDCCSPTCQVEASGTICRTAASACDAVESCDGVSSTCPSDFVLPSGALCRPSTGVCDLDEMCDGVGAACPGEASPPDQDSDGVCDDGDLCPAAFDPAQEDGDADGLGNACDPCTTGATVTKPFVKLTKFGTGPGDDTITFKGTFSLPTPAILEPHVVGVRVLLVDGNGATVQDVSVPAGLFNPITRTGWKPNPTGTSWTFLSPTLVDGLVRKVSIKTSTGTPQVIKFSLVGSKGAFAVGPPPVLPLAATFVIDAPVAASGRCGEAVFPGPRPLPSCGFNPSGSTLLCR